jgi:hypothetical protein
MSLKSFVVRAVLKNHDRARAFFCVRVWVASTKEDEKLRKTKQKQSRPTKKEPPGPKKLSSRKCENRAAQLKQSRSALKEKKLKKRAGLPPQKEELRQKQKWSSPTKKEPASPKQKSRLAPKIRAGCYSLLPPLKQKTTKAQQEAIKSKTPEKMRKPNQR